MIRTLITACVLFASFTSLHAGEKTAKRPITLEDLWKVQRLGKPSISPDGKWVAVDVTKFNMDDNSSSSQIWLCSTDGKTQKQLTTAKSSSTNPIWSPDGKSIAFLSKRGDATQIYVISPDGGEAKQISKLPMNPSGLKWGADSKTIYCVVWTWPDTPDDVSYKQKEKAKKDDKVQAYVIDDALYRVWDHWIADGKRPVVFKVDVEKGHHHNLFAGIKRTLPVSGGTAADYDVSPDGKEICFTSESARELGMDYNLDLFVLNIDTKPDRKVLPEPRNITADNPANDFAPVYSPDGKKIAFSRQTTKFFYADRVRGMLFERASQKSYELTANLDRSCNSPYWWGTGQEEGVMFEVEDKGLHLIGFSFADRKRAAALLHDEDFFGTSYSSSRDWKFGALLRSTFDMPTSLFSDQKNDGLGIRRPIEHFNDALRAEWDLGEVKNVTYKGADNDDVQMWIVYPPGFDKSKKWPCLMMIHGGPHNAITNDFHYRWNAHLFASKGYIVAIPNFHGSSGFGQKFTDSITGDMAAKPFIDVMMATDYMEALPYIDKNRTTAAGASYGGYMMAWLNGHTDRYKAMICHAGVYNWHSMMASDFVRGRERLLGALPFGDQAKIDKQNPQRFAANFKTPTLVMHGEKDYRVPVTQGFEYYNTLRIKGVPTRLVYFPDENHWIMRPQNARLWHREFFAWLEKHVGSGPTK
jgi:dipeptidyl aminopeptidase/acylaminoacyl peptidase